MLRARGARRSLSFAKTPLANGYEMARACLIILCARARNDDDDDDGEFGSILPLRTRRPAARRWRRVGGGVRCDDGGDETRERSPLAFAYADDKRTRVD